MMLLLAFRTRSAGMQRLPHRVGTSMCLSQHQHKFAIPLLLASPVQGPSYAALIAHRVWGRHPTRHRWAGLILAGAAVW